MFESASSLPTDDALKLYHAIQNCTEGNSPFAKELKVAMKCLADALRLYGPDGLVSSFNGGKDAVAILHLARAALAGHNERTGGSARLRAIFFEVADEFEVVDAFVRSTAADYDLDLICYPATGFAPAIARCISENDSKAFVLGTRLGDPNAAEQGLFTPSSDWMPPFMRVNPIIHWRYSFVWEFLRTFELPFCKLYEDGYTSLGKVSSTSRNPALLRPDGTYRPAWELCEEGLERAGRVESGKAKPDTSEGDDESEGVHAAQTAGLLIVGDEILSGKTADVNSFKAAKMLKQRGVKLRRITVVSDEISEVVSELGRLAGLYDVVITSGGLGPTHDDITLKAVAAAFSLSYEPSEEMSEVISAKMPANKLSPAVLKKMSTLPKGAMLRTVPGEPESWPILQVRNVFVLPGVPDFFEAKLRSICEHFVSGQQLPLSRKVLLRCDEMDLVAALDAAVDKHASVSFGSYPVDQGDVQTIITLEAKADQEATLAAALAALLASLPEGAVKEIMGDSMSLSPMASEAAASPEDPPSS